MAPTRKLMFWRSRFGLSVGIASESNVTRSPIVVGHETLKAGDGLRHDAMVGADHLAQILGVGARRQSGRTEYRPAENRGDRDFDSLHQRISPREPKASVALRVRGGTSGSNPASSSRESGTNRCPTRHQVPSCATRLQLLCLDHDLTLIEPITFQ
jgi:hypothetical protein